MKKRNYIFIITLWLMQFINAHAQINLVPNPSFEQDTACPSGISLFHYLKDWYRIGNTPDYFNKCYTNPNNDCHIPNSSFGYEYPADTSCNIYVGFVSYASYLSNVQETFGVSLINTLNVGVKYYISIKISLADKSKYATNNFGCRLTTYKPNSFYGASHPNNTIVKCDSIIKTSSGWVTIFKSFIADSSYKHLSIGQFYDDANTTYSIVNTNTLSVSNSYYFIDDVCLSADSLSTKNYTFSCSPVSLKDISIKDDFIFYPNPTNSLLFIEIPFGNLKYSLTDLTGIVLISNEIKSTKITIDVNSLPNGIYFLNVNNKIRKKIIIYKP